MAKIKNPISVSSRTFNSILNDIDSDPELADKPSWWKRPWAGVGDMLSIIQNAGANNGFLRTSFTRQAVKDLVELIDYILKSQTTSSGLIFFDVKSSSGTSIFPFTVTRANLKASSQGTTSASSLPFEARAIELFELVTDTFVADNSTDQLTVSEDILSTGWKVQLSTTGTLPAELSIATDYYLIYVSATIVKLATTRENAYLGNAIDFTDDGTGTHTINFFSKRVTVYQQELKSDVNIGISDGSSEWQELDLPDQLIIDETLTELIINSIVWTAVTTFVNSSSTDRHFKLLVKSEGQIAIQFGNGIYGLIPPNFDVFGTYGVGGGNVSNISVIDSVNSYAGSDSNITSVSNPSSLTGGNDEENLESAKKLAPTLLKSRDRFVTSGDGVALALGFGGLSQVKVNTNAFGVLSAQVTGIAFGGGNPNSTLKANLEAHLIDRSVLESMDVRVQDNTITSTNVIATVKLLSGFVFSSVQPFLDLAFELLLTETGQEIKDDFDANGLDSALVKINTILSHSFSSDDSVQVNLLLENLQPVQIGQQINSSDVLGYIDNFVMGVDYVEISTFGSGFPVVLADDEITTNGTIGTSEI